MAIARLLTGQETMLDPPSPPAPCQPSSAATPLITHDKELFDQAQIADQPRLPWDWALSGQKSDTPHLPWALDKWWYAYALENTDKPLVSSNVCRIMETELGKPNRKRTPEPEPQIRQLRTLAPYGS